MLNRSQPHIHDHLFRTRDGISLRCRIWIPDDPQKVALLIHGAGQHIEIYRDLGSWLARKGIIFIAFDLRGFGRSEGKRGHVNHFGEYLEDVDQLVRFFKEKFQGIPFHLIGHSLGGLIVTRYVQCRPGRVDGIILSAPALGFRLPIPSPADWVIRWIGNTLPSFSVNPYRWIKKAQRIPKLKSVVTHDVDGKINDPLVCQQYSFRWLQELLTQTKEAIQRVEEIMVPTLCICGGKDPLIHTEQVHSFFNRLAVKEKKWILLSDAEHRLLHPEQPVSAVDALTSWLCR